MADFKFVNPATYLKNVTKSISYSALDTTKEMMPAGADLIETNSETLKEVIATVRQPKKSLKTLTLAIKKSKVFEAGELAVKATLEDIATGNFYNKERIDFINEKATGVGGLTDFSDMEIDFDALDADIAKANDEEKVSKGDQYIGDMMAETSFASSQAISKTMVATSRYVAQSNKTSSTLMYNLNVKGFEMIGKGMTSVNQNVGQLVNFANITIKDYMEKTLKQHDRMLKLQEEQTVLLKNIHDMQAATQSKPPEQKQIKGGRYSDVMSGDTFDFKEYAKMVYNNILEETPLKSITSMNDAMGGDGANVLLAFAASPLKTVSDFMIKKAIPDMVKQSMESFNNTISGFFGTMLYRLTNFQSDEDSVLGEWVRKIFGVKSTIKNSIDTSNYQKGPIPFDGVTKKAIIETIPGYLARIESALTGRDERFFDYKYGSWRNYEDIQRETSNIKKRSVDNAVGDIKSEMQKVGLKTQEFRDEVDIKYFRQELDKFFESLYDGKKFFSPTDNKLSASDFDISEENFNRIKSLFSTLPRSMQTALYPRLMGARDQQNRSMYDIENSGDGIYNPVFNNGGSLNSYDKKTGRKLDSKLGFGTLANSTDKYGKTVFDWLKYQSERLVEIVQNTANITSGNKKKKSKSKTDISTQFKSYDDKGMGLQLADTVERQLQKESWKEYEGLYRENQRLTSKLKEKGIKVFSPEEFQKLGLDDSREYIAEYKKNINVIQALTQEEDDEKKVKSSTGQFFDKVKYYLDKPGKLVADIFERADNRIYNLMFGDAKELVTIDGQPVGSALEIMKVKFTLFFDDLKEKIDKILDPIFKKMKEFIDPFIDKAKEAARPLWESTKDAFRSAGGWMKNGFKEVYSPVKKLFEGDSELYGTKNKYDNIEDLELFADGTRMMKKTGLAVLSEGEMVIPQHLNPFYRGKRTPIEEQRKKEKRVKNNVISKFASSVGNLIPSFADGAASVQLPLTPEQYNKYNYMRDKDSGKVYNIKTGKVASEEEIGQYNTVNKNAFDKAKDDLVSGTKNIVNELSRIILGTEEQEGAAAKIQKKVAETSNGLFEKAVGQIKGDKIGFGGKAIAGAAIGAGASLLTGGLISPLLAASIGSATSMVISSDKTRDWLFGTRDENGDLQDNGVLPKSLVDGIVKYVPSMAKHGAVGALTAMIPFVPGGPIAGLMVGSAVGFLKENQAAQDWLFGEDGLFGKSKEDIAKSLKQKLPKILAGAGLGGVAGMVLGGPFGLVGNMMLGGGLGFLTTNKKFQQAVFGVKDENGKVVEDGLVQKLGKWVKKNILDQLKDFIKPMTNRITHFFERMGKGAGGFLSKQFEKWVGIPISRALNEYLIKPMSKIAKPFLSLGKVFIKAAVSPLSLLGGVGRHMQRKDLKKGNSAYLGNAAERLKRREELGMGTDDFYGKLDLALQDMSSEELKDTSELIKNVHSERINRNKQRVDARAAFQSEMGKTMGEEFKNRDIMKISSLIEKGKEDEALKLIGASRFSIFPGQERRFSKYSNEEILNVFKTTGKEYSNKVQSQKQYEKDLEKVLSSRFGKGSDAVKKLMNGESGDFLKMINKELSSRTNEEKEADKLKAEDNKFKNDLLSIITDIRNALTGEKTKKKKPNVKAGPKLHGEKDDEEEEQSTPLSPFEEFQNAQIKVFKGLTDPEAQAKLEEEKEKHIKRRTIFTPNGPMNMLRDYKGGWKFDDRDASTRRVMANEKSDDQNAFKTATFTEKISNFFDKLRYKNGEDGEETLFGKALGFGGKALKAGGSILKKLLSGTGLLMGGSAAIAALGWGSEKVRETQIGSRIMDWLFGGKDEEGNEQEGILTKIGNVFVEKIPDIMKRINKFMFDTFMKTVDFIGNNSEKVGNWISEGIELFTNNLIRLLEKAPVVAKVIGDVLPKIINPIAAAIPPVITALSNNIGPVINALGDALPSIAGALGNAVGTLVSQLPKILTAIIQSSKQLIPNLFKALGESVKALVYGILGIPYDPPGEEKTAENYKESVTVGSDGSIKEQKTTLGIAKGFAQSVKNGTATSYKPNASTNSISYISNDISNYSLDYVDENSIPVTIENEDGTTVDVYANPGTPGYEELSSTFNERRKSAGYYNVKADPFSNRYPADKLVISAAHAAQFGFAVKNGKVTGLNRITKVSTAVARKLGKFGAQLGKDAIARHGIKKANKVAQKASNAALKRELAQHTMSGRFLEKVGSKAGNVIKGIKSGVKNVASDVLTKATEALGNKVSKVTSLSKSITENMGAKIGTLAEKVWAKIISIPKIGKYLGGAGKACKKFITQLVPQLSKAAGKAAAKTAMKLAATVLNILLVVYYFTEGFSNAEAYLKVENATQGQRVVCGLLNVVNEYITFGLVPLENVLDMLLNTIGEALGIADEIKEQQEQLKLTVDDYNTTNNTNLSVSEYQKDVLGQQKGISGIFKQASKVANSFFNKKTSVTTSTTGTKGRATTSSFSAKGTGISSLIERIDPNAPEPILSQTDSRIAKKKFGNSTVGESGCAPSSAAIILNDITGNSESIQITDTLNPALKYQNQDGSVNADYFKDIFSKYGFKTDYIEKRDKALAELKKGQELVLLGEDENNTSKLKSPFGRKSHFVVASEIKNGKIVIADPETGQQVLYDKSILNNVDLAVAPKGKGRSGSGTFRRFAGSGGLSDSQVQQNKDIVYNYLVTNMGFSTAAAVGIMTNIKHESGFNPGQMEYGYTWETGGGYGLCGWTDCPRTAGKGNRTKLVKFAEKNNKDKSDLVLQLDFLKKQLESGYGKLVARLRSYPNTAEGAGEAARDFCVTYERPAYTQKTGEKRRKASKALWEEYKDKPGGPVVGNGYSSSGDASSSSSNSLSGMLTGLTTSLMKDVYGDGILDLFGMSDGGDATSTPSGDIITNSSATTAKNFFTETLKGTVTSPYGPRVHPVTGKQSFHSGIDIGANGGTKIPSPVSGVVKSISNNTGYGNLLILKDKDSYEHYFGHMQKKPGWKVGDQITKGQEIGLVGTTGTSTGNHLHYEVRIPAGTKSTDPDNYLQSYFDKGGSGSGLNSPYRNIDKAKFNPSGPKGGVDSSMLDVNILEALVSVISKILDDTNHIAQIKDLLVEYFAADKEASTSIDNTSANQKKQKARDGIVNIINTNSNSNEVDERKKMILTQLKTLISN